MEIKLGSLFDGSGGFPLAGALHGISPVWASEVEPYPIAVTTSRFPRVKHLGDISAVNGAEIEPVDIITFGSPCQDLSIAGRRAGLDGERSGLFMQAVRIIKEMRAKTNGIYPTFAIWENVPGAFSSNKGADFRVVLEELIRIVEPCAEVPPADKGGWPYADCYMGDGWSLAYRLFDAQYWGVPQRRRRIHLVADFRGERAPAVLFEPQSLQGDTEAVCGERKGAPAPSGESPCNADYARFVQPPAGFNGHRSITGSIEYHEERAPCINVKMPPNVVYPQVARSLTARHDGSPCADRGPNVVAVHQNQSGEVRTGEVANTLNTNGNASGRNAPLIAQVYDTRGNGDGATVGTITGDHNNRVTDYTAVLCMATQQGGAEICEGICPTITAAAGMSGNNQPVAVLPFDTTQITSPTNRSQPKYGDPCHPLAAQAHPPAICLQGNMIGRTEKNGPQGDGLNEDVSFTLTEADRHAVAYSVDRAAFNQGKNAQYDISIKEGPAPSLVAQGPSAVAPECEDYAVRRLTPTECARLQGFPDWWGRVTYKDDFTEEEIAFWNRVDFTKRVIDGRLRLSEDDGAWHIWAVPKGKKEPEDTGRHYKPMDKRRTLNWYNGLESESAEYKMWGNGIALPPALFVLGRAAEQLRQEANDEADT